MIVDNFSRVSPVLGVGFRDKGYDVVSLSVTQYGMLERIRVDNGPQVISKEVDLWAYAHRLVLEFSRPGKTHRQCLYRIGQQPFSAELPERALVLSLEDPKGKSEGAGQLSIENDD
jgi:putative transposase